MRMIKGMALAVFAAVTLTACSSGESDNRTDVALDVADLWREIALYYVDNSTDPVVTYSGGKYYVDGLAIEARAKNPDLEFEGNGPDDWCVTILYNGGAAAVSDGSNWELQDKAGC
ncbi:MAG: hypothetical protein JW722_07310 [Demequinaceae bacterium]|nr:hypothetical protein [Demequinaceae bacterium]